MKIKTILCILIIFIVVFLIYLTTMDKKIYYLNLSIDENTETYDQLVKNYLGKKDKLERYVSGFTNKDDRVTDLMNAIEQNKKITIDSKEQTIKNALIKADLVTVFIGLNDINYKVGYSSMNELYDYADSFLNDIEDLLELLREYCKEDIILIGYYNIYGSYYDEYFNYINREMESYAEELDIHFIKTNDIYTMSEDRANIFMTREEHHDLFTKIQKLIDTNVLNG